MGIPTILTRISLAVKCDAFTFKVARMEIRIRSGFKDLKRCRIGVRDSFYTWTNR